MQPNYQITNTDVKLPVGQPNYQKATNREFTSSIEKPNQQLRSRITNRGSQITSRTAKLQKKVTRSLIAQLSHQIVPIEKPGHESAVKLPKGNPSNK